MERRHENVLDKLKEQLEDSKDTISGLKRNEAVIEVYKKKVEQMGDLRSELSDALEQN